MSSFTCTSTSSNKPLGYLFERSANWITTLVSFKSPRFNDSYTEYGIKLMDAPKSHNALPSSFAPITHGMVKLPASFNFGGSFLCKIVDTSPLKATVS
ncbi:hypothetical protein ACFX2G_000292 [Malus domestica]